MSLINEALKKAQHMRSESQGSLQADVIAPGGSSQARRRGTILSPKVLLLAAGGVILLVSGSVAATILLTRRPSLPQPSGSQPVSPRITTPEPVVRTAPVATVGEAAVAIRPASEAKTATIVLPPSFASPPPNPAPPAFRPAPEVVPSLSVPQPAPAPMPEAKPSTPDIAAIMATYRVTGIRASGNDSKVLMNDRVYRVGDVVDRTLGLKLVEVANDHLVFVDPQGTRHVRNF
jgi:hypothetical protein